MTLILDHRGQPLPPSDSIGIDAHVSDEIRKAVSEITSQFFERVESEGLMTQSQQAEKTGKPKGYFNDPFSMLDSLGMGYRANPSNVTYETLRQMTEKDTLLAAILLTRIRQVTGFCRKQENKYAIGFKVKPIGCDDSPQLLDDDMKKRVARVEKFVCNMGVDRNIERDGFVKFASKFVRDRLTYDQSCFEKVWTRGGKLHSVYMHDGATMRIAQPPDIKGAPLPPGMHGRTTRYIQLVNGEVAAQFTPRELCFAVANPRTSIHTYGYGFPEPQMLIQTVTAHLWAEEWNRNVFRQGSTIKGVLNLKGNIPRDQFESFKRQWHTQTAGVRNAWKTPLLNSDGIDFTPIQLSNTEMGYQMWIEYLVKIACAIYQMDPTEINFDTRGGAGQQPAFLSSNEAQQEISKDRGLKPLLGFFADELNRHVIQSIDEDLEIAFVGLDAKTEEQAIELRQKQTMTTHTINEARALESLPPVEHGDVIANPPFMGYLQQKEMAGGGMPGMPGGEEGGDDQGPPPEQPYANKFGGEGGKAQSQGPEEKEAKDRLAALAEGVDVSEKTHRRRLFTNDWTAKSDLRKSTDTEVEFYDLLDV